MTKSKNLYIFLQKYLYPQMYKWLLNHICTKVESRIEKKKEEEEKCPTYLYHLFFGGKKKQSPKAQTLL